MRLILTLVSLFCLTFAASPLHAQEAASLPESVVTQGKTDVGVTIEGNYSEEAALAVQRNALIKFGDTGQSNFRVTFDWMPEAGYMQIWVKPESEKPAGTTKAASFVTFQAQNTGYGIIANRPDWSEEDQKWAGGTRLAYIYRPYARNARNIDEDDIETDRFTGQWQQVQIDVTPERASIWLEGRLARNVEFSDNSGSGPVVVGFVGQTQKIRNVRVTPHTPSPVFRPVDFSNIANDAFRHPFTADTVTHDGVTFELAPDRRSLLNLKNAKWIDQPRDPQSYYEDYDAGPPFIYDDRMPFFRIPKADYIAAHLLAVAEDDAAFTSNLTIRAGAYGHSGQVLQQDFTAAVPRAAEVAKLPADQRVALRQDLVAHVVVPFDVVVEQDLLSDYMEMEFTKELRPTRHVPDPNRFRIRPMGLPSGVKIAAITMELSPLQVHVSSSESAHAFVEPAKPAFKVDLQNITDAEQPYSIQGVATHLHGKTATTKAITGKVAPGETTTVTVPFDLPMRGYYDVSIDITVADGKKTLARKTTLALLPPDTRKFRDQAPFGTWDWSGGHVTVKEVNQVGSMYKKLGFRYGMTRYTPEERAKWGMLPGFEPTISEDLAKVRRDSETADTKKKALIFHENSISGGHVTRVPDMFTDRPPYKLSEREEQNFAKLWNLAMVGGKAMREEFPDWYIKLGNGPLPTKEIMYQRKFPAELFDAAGNEPGSFHRLPETQPPDYVAYNASIFMDRRMLEHYGYGDKDVRQCFEVGYPGSNPTNHSESTQADYFVRLCLHSLGWEMPFIHIGMINDAGNSYYFSNWGSTGFANKIPDASVKPAFVALSNMTLALDGAKLVEDIDTGSPSVFLLNFKRGDGKTVLAYWTIRGSRDVTLDVTGDNWTIMTDQGNDVAPTQTGSSVTVTLGQAPHYLIGDGEIKGLKNVASPTYTDAPADNAVVVDKLADLSDWEIIKERSPELESYNFMTPRRHGDFTFNPVKTFEGRDNVVSVKANPVKTGTEYMPMYMELAHKQGGVELPGKPTEIGLWVNGNSGWGRIIYELEDASGQTWKSIGRQAVGDPHPWLLDWMTPEMLAELGTPQNDDWNTNDAYQHSRFNFDGWRYVAFPVPGNYIGENHPWPGNCNWKISGDGVVKYPLKVTKLIFELPEKVLHVQRYDSVKRPEVYFTSLSVSDRGKPMIP